VLVMNASSMSYSSYSRGTLVDADVRGDGQADRAVAHDARQDVLVERLGDEAPSRTGEEAGARPSRTRLRRSQRFVRAARCAVFSPRVRQQVTISRCTGSSALRRVMT